MVKIFSWQKEPHFLPVCNAVMTLLCLIADIDECALSPCKNGGTCQQLPTSGYLCNCAKDFIGDNCETCKMPITMATA